jgi:putative hydrolase of the HAD superfamily
MTLKAIFFDVGHTLLHPAVAVPEVCHRLLLSHGWELPLPSIEIAVHHQFAEDAAQSHLFKDDWACPEKIEALWLRYYRRVFEQLQIQDPDASLAHQMISWYGQPQAWQLFPDVSDTLRCLRQRGFCLGAVSDWAPSLLSILHGHGLTRYFDFVLCSGVIGFCKPTVQFYKLALKRAGVEPYQALHIGDNYYADVRGARAAGITPVLLDRAGAALAVDCVVIRELSEIEMILAHSVPQQ